MFDDLDTAENRTEVELRCWIVTVPSAKINIFHGNPKGFGDPTGRVKQEMYQ